MKRRSRCRGEASAMAAKFHERAFIAQVEAADAEELRRLLSQPNIDQERALRGHLGDDRYQRMRRLARRTAELRPGDRGGTKPLAERRGRVIVLPGIMGSELTATDRSGVADNIWLSILRIIAGRIERLR